MKRCKELVLKKVTEIKSKLTRKKQRKFDCTEKYANPPIPEGYKYVCGQWNDGLVIERLSDKSQFVWVPVGGLEANGTLDGNHFNEKFGRRNFRNDAFSKKDYFEPFEGELILQFESIKRYGGFYISRFDISQNKKNGKPQSIKGKKPWVKMDFDGIMKVAESMEESKYVKSHLIFGSEYDSVLEWLIESKSKTYDEIAKDSSYWGRYFNISNLRGDVSKTGSDEKWIANNIYDLAGNVLECTQEQNNTKYHVIRGGSHYEYGKDYPVAYRDFDVSHYAIGFRVVLRLE